MLTELDFKELGFSPTDFSVATRAYISKFPSIPRGPFTTSEAVREAFKVYHAAMPKPQSDEEYRAWMAIHCQRMLPGACGVGMVFLEGQLITVDAGAVLRPGDIFLAFSPNTGTHICTVDWVSYDNAYVYASKGDTTFGCDLWRAAKIRNIQ